MLSFDTLNFIVNWLDFWLPFGICGRQHVFFQQFLVGRIHLSRIVNGVFIFIDQVDVETQIMIGENFKLVRPFEGRWIVLYESD